MGSDPTSRYTARPADEAADACAYYDEQASYDPEQAAYEEQARDRDGLRGADISPVDSRRRESAAGHLDQRQRRPRPEVAIGASLRHAPLASALDKSRPSPVPGSRRPVTIRTSA